VAKRTTQAARNRQRLAGAKNYRDVVRLLDQERRTNYGRRPPDGGERVKPPAGPVVG
jgi:hypothetical protein